MYNNKSQIHLKSSTAKMVVVRVSLSMNVTFCKVDAKFGFIRDALDASFLNSVLSASVQGGLSLKSVLSLNMDRYES